MNILRVVFVLSIFWNLLLVENLSAQVLDSNSLQQSRMKDSTNSVHYEKMNNREEEKGEWDFNNRYYKLVTPPLFWQSPISLPDNFIVDSTLNITINNYLLIEGEHYIYNRDDKLIYFNVKIKPSDEVLIYYKSYPVKIENYFYLDSMSIYNSNVNEDEDKKSGTSSDSSFISGVSSVSFDYDGGGFNISRFIDLSISGKYEDSISIEGEIYDENVEDRYSIEKELSEIQKLSLKIDNGHGKFIAGDYVKQDTNMITYISRELRGASTDYSGKLFGIRYGVDGFVGSENIVSEKETIPLIFGIKGPYKISSNQYYASKVEVIYEGRVLQEDVDYTFNSEKGYIYILFNFAPGSTIDVKYYTKESDEGRSLLGGKVSAEKGFFYSDMNIVKGFGGVEKNRIIKYLPGDTLAVVSGEDVISLSEVVFGAYKKNSNGGFTFFRKEQLSTLDTIYSLTFYDAGKFGEYMIDEVNSYKSNGEMVVYKYDPYSMLSTKSVGRVVRVKNDFVIINNKVGLTADSIFNFDISKAELLRNSEIAHAVYGHLDLTLDSKRVRDRKFPFDAMKLGYDIFYKDKDYLTVDNYRDASFYKNSWLIEQRELSLLNSETNSVEKSELENTFLLNIKNRGLKIVLNPSLLRIGSNKRLFNVNKFDINALYNINNRLIFNSRIRKFYFTNWLEKYTKFTQNSSIDLHNKTYEISPFFNSALYNFTSLDSVYTRNHFGLNINKNFTKNLSLNLLLQRYNDKVVDKEFNIIEESELVSNNQLITGLNYNDLLNSFSGDFDYFNDELQSVSYSNFNVEFTRKTKAYEFAVNVSNRGELNERSMYRHQNVGALNGDYVYDSLSSNFVYVGANMGDISLYEESSVDNNIIVSKEVSAQINTDYIVSPFGEVTIKEISNKSNIIPMYPTFDNIGSRDFLSFDYKAGFWMFKDEKLEIYRKESHFYKYYEVFNEFEEFYDMKKTLLYNSSVGWYVNKRCVGKNIDTDIAFDNVDKVGIFYDVSKDTTYVINQSSLGYSSTYHFIDELDILFGNSAQLNRELSVHDSFLLLKQSLGGTFFYKKVSINLLNELFYRVSGNDSIFRPYYFNTYKKGLNYDLSINSSTQVSKELSFSLSAMAKFRKGEDPWFHLLLNGSYSF